MRRQSYFDPMVSHSPTYCPTVKELGVCCFYCAKLKNSNVNHQNRFSCSLKFFFPFGRTLGLIILYYCFSIGLTFYQKWFIKDFHYPLTTVICHLVVKFMLAWFFRALFQFLSGKERVVLNWTVYFKQLAPTGIASALDIGLSNWSFEYITVSLYTMTKSTCIIFILGFSLLLGLEKKRCSLVVVVILISAGLFMFTYQSTQFNLEGFLLVLSASFLAGLRWTMAQLIVQRKDLGLTNPIDMIYHVQPWMIICLLPLAAGFEGTSIASTEKAFKFRETNVVLTTLGFALVGSIFAFLMEVSEYLLLIYTSSLTLSIAGVFKEVCTLYLAVHYAGDSMSSLNVIGLIICLMGISVHVILKAVHSNDQEDAKEHDGWQHLLSTNEVELDDADSDVIFEATPVS